MSKLTVGGFSTVEATDLATVSGGKKKDKFAGLTGATLQAAKDAEIKKAAAKDTMSPGEKSKVAYQEENKKQAKYLDLGPFGKIRVG